MLISSKFKNVFTAVTLYSLTTGAAVANDNVEGFVTDDPSGLDYALIGDTESPQKILVMLHGSGDNYLPLASGAENIPDEYDDLLIIVPNGPVSFAEILPPAQIEQIMQQNPTLDLENMRNWSGQVNLSGNETEAEIMQLLEESQYETADALNALISAQLEKYDLDGRDVSLYGFSAGGSMAMYAGLRADQEYGEVLNHSGALYGPYENPPSTPPITIIIGDREPPLLQGLPIMVETLEAEGVSVTYEILNNTGHEFNQEVVTHFYNFIDRLMEDAQQMEPALEPVEP